MKKLFKCNHYKFKSDEEYDRRTIEFNKGGHMKNKLNHSKTTKWKIRANQVNNFEITTYIDKLKEHMNKPIIKNVNTSYFLSVVTMFRYEDEYLNEWLHYYIMHGVEHFFLYSHNNTENTIKILQPFIDNGYVTLIEWKDEELLKVPKKKRRTQWGHIVGWKKTIGLQNLALMDFVKKHKSKTKWIIKIDVDEFIYPTNKQLKIKDVLLNTKTIYFLVPRKDFGNNNHITKPNGLILENYTKSEIKNSSFKAIALTKHISPKDPGYAHEFTLL
jgi:hypothetical protein